MRTENSNITTDSTEIKRMRTLWITVYQQTGHPRWNRQITRNTKSTKVNNEKRRNLNRLVTSKKIQYIKNKNKPCTNKIPGSDGFMGEFYHIFEELKLTSVI